MIRFSFLSTSLFIMDNSPADHYQGKINNSQQMVFDIIKIAALEYNHSDSKAFAWRLSYRHRWRQESQRSRRAKHRR